MKLHKFLSSSVNPESLSLTVKGIIVGAIPFIIFVAKLKGFDLPETSITEFADSIGNVIVQVGTAVSAVIVVIGLVRKIAVALGFIKQK